MVWRDGGSGFAASTLRKAFDAARGDDGSERAASAAVVAALLPHVEANERTLAESVETLRTCLHDVDAVETLVLALANHVRDDRRLAAAIARVAGRAHEVGAVRALLVLLDVLLETPENACFVEDAWGAAAVAGLSEAEIASSPRVDRVRRRWAEHRKTRPSWIGDVDDEKTDLHAASFFRARHAEMLALEEAARDGRTVGRYRLLEEIGAGGMGRVHLARIEGCNVFQRWAAIKQSHPYLRGDEMFVEMLLDEARLTAAITHPNVASVFEFGKAEDGYWIAMEYLHGESLSEWLGRVRAAGCPVPPEIACRIIADAAAGLHAAHELTAPDGTCLEVVHRDVTPQNLVVTFDGVTKVVDFGLPKLGPATRTGSRCVAGKLAYMSPEQVRGERLDRRTDVFALAVVLWELTTGRRLFRRDSELDTLTAVVSCEPARPSTVVAGYPADLERLIMKALAKDPDGRFKTARDFSRALQALLLRRGLLIAPDDVGGYARTLLGDRLRARDARLARHS